MKMLCINESYEHLFTLYRIYEVWQGDSGKFFVNDNEGDYWPLFHHGDGFYRVRTNLFAEAQFIEVPE